jgi:hypothetical protein
MSSKSERTPANARTDLRYFASKFLPSASRVHSRRKDLQHFVAIHSGITLQVLERHRQPEAGKGLLPAMQVLWNTIDQVPSISKIIPSNRIGNPHILMALERTARIGVSQNCHEKVGACRKNWTAS